MSRAEPSRAEPGRAESRAFSGGEANLNLFNLFLPFSLPPSAQVGTSQPAGRSPDRQGRRQEGPGEAEQERQEGTQGAAGLLRLLSDPAGGDSLRSERRRGRRKQPLQRRRLHLRSDWRGKDPLLRGSDCRLPVQKDLPESVRPGGCAHQGTREPSKTGVRTLHENLQGKVSNKSHRLDGPAALFQRGGAAEPRRSGRRDLHAGQALRALRPPAGLPGRPGRPRRVPGHSGTFPGAPLHRRGRGGQAPLPKLPRVGLDRERHLQGRLRGAGRGRDGTREKDPHPHPPVRDHLEQSLQAGAARPGQADLLRHLRLGRVQHSLQDAPGVRQSSQQEPQAPGSSLPHLPAHPPQGP
ncbi:hypothetical protein HWI79_1009 [Cryptosporidium felis]|nr:hypothetical protein HWI79_1009 [Cryptosporidium felis]